MSKYIVTADADWIQGHLRYGHWEMELTGAEYEEFKSLSEDEQIEYLRDVGSLIVDDYEIDDYGVPSNLEVNELN